MDHSLHWGVRVLGTQVTPSLGGEPKVMGWALPRLTLAQWWCGSGRHSNSSLSSCLFLFGFQVKAQDRTQTQLPRKKCAVCGTKLGPNWEKPLCPDCVNSLVRDDSVASCHNILSSVKDKLASTFQSFKGMMDRMQGPSPSLVRAASLPSLSEPSQEAEEDRVRPRSLASSQVDSASDSEGEDDSSRVFRYKLSLDDVGDLLKAIYDTLEIRKEQVQLSRYDLMYQGSSAHKARVFPVHKSLIESILLEWEQPEKRPFFSGSLKRRFPFEADASHPWNKIPKLDAPLAKV